jgi:hypothetical protein
VNVPENSTWRCGCGAEQTSAPTTYAVALRALREHQADTSCKKQIPGTGDRIHSKRTVPVSELHRVVDKEPPMELHGPPRPPTQRPRLRREGLPWLPGNGAVLNRKSKS